MDIEIKEVLSKYSTLTYNSEKNILEGNLFISKEDSYDLLIELDSYPEFFPIVYETSERIPKKMSRHVYTDTGSCCFTTKAKSQVLLKTKIKDLYSFIKEFAIPYFQNNSYFELNRKYKFDEYSHGILGVIEGYRDILKINDDYLIFKLMYSRIKGQKLKIRNSCYCESGLSLKKCSLGLYDASYRDFKKINKSLLEHDLYAYFKKHLNL